jgi:hypothetical protein
MSFFSRDLAAGLTFFDLVLVLAPLLLGGAGLALFRALGHLRVVIRDPGDPGAPLALVRAIRGVVVALALLVLVVAAATRSAGWTLFGLVFLGEELYETGVVLLLLRLGHRRLAAS